MPRPRCPVRCDDPARASYCSAHDVPNLLANSRLRGHIWPSKAGATKTANTQHLSQPSVDRMISTRTVTQEIIMTLRILTAALFVAAATPALAQGIDSKHSP